MAEEIYPVKAVFFIIPGMSNQNWKRAGISLAMILVFYVVTAPPLFWLNYRHRNRPLPIPGLRSVLAVYCFPVELPFEIWQDSKRQATSPDPDIGDS